MAEACPRRCLPGLAATCLAAAVAAACTRPKPDRDETSHGIPGHVASSTEVASPRGEATVLPLFDPATRDPTALQRIAETHRATVLWSLVASRRPESTAALLALAGADDLEAVVWPLSELVLDRTRDDRLEILRVLHAFALRRPTSAERLAPDGLVACFSTLRRVATSGDEDARIRARAVSVVRGFERAGLVASPEAAR